MRRLFVLYDSECGLCTWARGWLCRQPMYLELVFVPAGSARAHHLFPDLSQAGPVEELVVISDEGGVYRSASAWIMCLYALQDYREWALRLARPHLKPLARQAFALLSKHRRRVSRWFDLESEAQMVEMLRKVVVPVCTREEGRVEEEPAAHGFL